MLVGLIVPSAYFLSVLSIVLMMAGLFIMMKRGRAYLWLGAGVLAVGAIAGGLVLLTEI